MQSTNRDDIRIAGTGRWLGAAAALLVGLAGAAAPATADVRLSAPGDPGNSATRDSRNKHGWTVLTPAPDTKFVFVSSSEGNDLSNGRSPANAVRTLARAKELMRNNSADWMLLRKGDTWNETFGAWRLSGRSVDEPVVIASYGEYGSRPVIRCVNDHGISAPYGDDVSHVAIVGLKFLAVRDANSTHRGIRWQSVGEGLLIEDCHIEGFHNNLSIEGITEGFEDVRIRRNVIIDAWSVSGHAQGIFAKDVTGLLLEQNVIDRNGWSPTVPGADPTTFKQNVYLQVGVTGVEFLGNITSRSAAAGIQMRSGGVAEDNLIYANPMGIRFGYRTLEWPQESATGAIRRNVVLGGPLAYQAPEMFAIWTERSRNLRVEHNVVANASPNTVPTGISLGGGAENAVFSHNTVYAWTANGAGQALKFTVDTTGQEPGTVTVEHNRWYMPASQRVMNVRTLGMIAFWDNDFIGISPNAQAFFMDGRNGRLNDWLETPNVTNDAIETVTLIDAGRDLRDYANELGFTDEVAFLNAARQLSKDNWDIRLTGTAASEWIRAGYQVQP